MMEIENLYQTPKSELETTEKPYVPGPFSWRGRIGRVDYFLFILFAYFIANSFAFILVAVLGSDPHLQPWIGQLLAFLWIALLSKRRLQDFNSSGRMAALIFVPGFNFLLMLGLLYIRGDQSDNEYGQPPILKNERKHYFYFFLFVIISVSLLLFFSAR